MSLVMAAAAALTWRPAATGACTPPPGSGPASIRSPAQPAMRPARYQLSSSRSRAGSACREAGGEAAAWDQLAVAMDAVRGMQNASAGPQRPDAVAGECWLVGAGPGSLEHLTLGAVALIQKADVIIFDDLGTQAAVEAFAPAATEQVYVGKRGLQQSFKQSQIDALLVDHCLQGKRVVRLKGGCPSTFSRVSGEMAALTAAGVPFHLVPGVSSAFAAPLLAGFPLTDKLLGRAFTVISGHNPNAIDWEALRGFETIVFLMAGNSLPGIVAGLQSITEADLPIAVIRDASSIQQCVWTATVSTLVETTRGQRLSPSIIVVGNVVGLMPSVGGMATAEGVKQELRGFE